MNVKHWFSFSLYISTYIKTHVLFCLPCRLPQACRSPVAPLSPSYRLPVAKKHPAALLLLSCRFLPLLPCCLPVAASPDALLSSYFHFPVAHPVPTSYFLLLPCRRPVATLSPPCCPRVAPLLQLPCCRPVACLLLPIASLPLSCRFPVVFLSPPCRLPVATLSPSCCTLPHFTVACFAQFEFTHTIPTGSTKGPATYTITQPPGDGVHTARHTTLHTTIHGPVTRTPPE